MDEADDGIGSEVNTPRGAECSLIEGSPVRREHECDVPKASSTSTPLNPERRPRLNEYIPEISPIKETREIFVLGNGSAESEDSSLDGEASDSLEDSAGILEKQKDAIALEHSFESYRYEKEREFETLQKQNADYKNRLRIMDSQLSELQKKVFTVESEFEKVNGERETLLKELDNLRKAVADSEQNLDDWRKRCHTAELKLKNYERISVEVEADKNLAEKTQKQLEKVQRENAELRTLMHDSELRAQQHEKECIKERDLIALEEKLAAARQECIELDASKRRLLGELEEVRASHEEEMEEQRKLKEKKERAAMEGAEKEIAEMKAEFELMRREYEEKEKEFETEKMKLLEELESVKKTREAERERARELSAEMDRRVAALTEEKNEIVREKEILLRSSNEASKQIVMLREESRRVEENNAKQQEKLKRLEKVEKEATDLRNELANERLKVFDLGIKLEECKADAKKFRDEVHHLRAKKLATPADAMGKDSREAEHLKKLMQEVERLHAELDANRGLKAEWALYKSKMEEMTAEVEKRDAELTKARDWMDEKRREADSLEKERNVLAQECERLKLELECLTSKFLTFQNNAELQYQAETTHLREIINEKDERLNRLITRISEYESYPGRSTPSSGTSSIGGANVTLWDAIPEEIRLQLASLRERYNELNDVVQCLMTSSVIANESSRNSKPSLGYEDKVTDCFDLGKNAKTFLRPDAERPPSLPTCETVSSGETISDGRATVVHVPYRKESLSSLNNAVANSLNTLLACINAVEIRTKLSPNIRQLLSTMLLDVKESGGSQERIRTAVDNFFSNLDLALKQTLATSEENRRKCAELGTERARLKDELRVLGEELRAAQNRRDLNEERVEKLRLELRDAVRQLNDARNEVERSAERNRLLISRNEGLSGALEELKLIAEKKTEMGNQAAKFIEQYQQDLDEANRYMDELNEKLRIANHDKEVLRRDLSNRDLEIVRIESRLVDRTNECTARAADLRQSEKRNEILQKENAVYKRKYEKREGFLEEMERLLNLMKVRNHGLKVTNRLRQNKIDLFMEFLSRHGLEVDSLEGQIRSDQVSREVAGSDVDAGLNNRGSGQSANLGIAASEVVRLLSRLRKHSSEIEIQEQNNLADDIRAPLWRSADDLAITHSGIAPIHSVSATPPQNLLKSNDKILNSL